MDCENGVMPASRAVACALTWGSTGTPNLKYFFISEFQTLNSEIKKSFRSFYPKPFRVSDLFVFKSFRPFCLIYLKKIKKRETFDPPLF